MNEFVPTPLVKGVPATTVADTPFSYSSVASPETLRNLEFDRALDAVAAYAASELGAEAIRRRTPHASPEWIQSELARAGELQRVWGAGAEFVAEHLPDIRASVATLGTPGSVLEPKSLLAMQHAMAAMRRVRAGLDRMAGDAPLMGALAVDVPPADLERRIERAIDPDGSVRDDALPQLARARRKIRETRALLLDVLHKIQNGFGSSVSEGEVTVRGDRYVIPIRREARGRARGIVHGESGSGATVFVEPAEAVELGNDLSSAVSEEARAVLEVLRGLTEGLRASHDAIVQGLDMCTRVDDACARASFANAHRAVVPGIVSPAAKLRIATGVHPLLAAGSQMWAPHVASHQAPVPFDLAFDDDEYTVVVSGPNAGGKTVFLKAVGLIQCLAQSGIVPPVGAGTTLPVFDQIFSDIGDHQSIAANLSTFTAHLVVLKRILASASDGTLVLLDELGSGTDPVEGAALAGAILTSLNGRKSTTIATTHLSHLKELAARTPGVANASLRFDVETLTPTYHFVKDQPGRSYGLAIAKRVGLPGEVLAVAEGLQPEWARSLENTLADLERREQALTDQELRVSEREARAARERRSLAEWRTQLEQRDATLHERERASEREGREKARAYLLEARRLVEEALGKARAAVDEATAKEARRLVEQGVKKEGDALARLKELGREKGWTVRSKADRRIGGRAGDPAAGRTALASPSPVGAQHAGVGAQHAAPMDSASATTEIDLRGMRADEAEAALLAAIDDAVVGDLPWLRIIHGKGTGALRERVRELLSGDRRVTRFHLAPTEQGGTGVTIAAFTA